MTSQTQSLTLSDKLRAVTRRASPAARPIRRVRDAMAAALREVWAILHAASDLRNEIRRMADECEATRPEQAAQLRKVANSNWVE